MLVRTIQIDDLWRSNVLLKVYVVYYSCPDDILHNSCLSSFWTSIELRKLATPPVNYAQYFSYNIHVSIFHLKPFENLFFWPFFELKNAPRNTSIVVDGFPLRIAQENRSV